MPIYEYVCETCDAPHEALQKINDTPLTDCPSCGESSLKKQISAPGFRLSGSGWYETDFKSSKQRNLAESKDSSKKEGNKKQSKPAHSCGSGGCSTSP
jgi:putative FmdB family regulatory protein